MEKVLIEGEIGYWGVSARDIKWQLNRLSGDVEIEINSPGGSVFEGISIYNAIKDYDKGQITTVIKGMAASMASYIALAGDTVKAYDNATYMIHNARMFTGGDHNQLRKDANIIEGLSTLLRKAYISRTGKSEKIIQKAMDEETFYFGDEILSSGFVDEIVPTTEDKNKQTAIAFTHEAFKSCMKNVEAKLEELDVNEVAALLKIEKISANSQNNTNNNNSCYNNNEHISNKEEIQNMTIDKLKAEHPEVYAQVVKLGMTSEQDRVNAHITMANSTGATQYALDCIASGEGLSQTAQAKYMTFGLNNQDVVARTEEEVPAIETPANTDDVDENNRDEAFAKSMKVDLKAIKGDSQ